jgi:trehalose/maltose hydrolase-like predicted phosphorylase
MAVVFGFAGLALRGDRVVLSPSLPAHWRSLAFQFRFQEQAFALRISDQAISIVSDERNSQDIWLEVDGHPAAKCAAGKSLAWDAWRTMGRTNHWQKAEPQPAEEKTEPESHPLHSFA